MTVAGHVKTCRKVLGSNISLDRDAHYNQDRYSCRMVVTHGSEQLVFDILKNKGYELITNCKTGAANLGTDTRRRKESLTTKRDYHAWNHVTYYIFRRK